MEHRKLNSLKANPLNPRGEVVHDVALRELAASIKSQGVLQPILITSDGLIIAGHRRVVAARLAGLPEVPVIVRDLTETQQLQVMLVENIQRNDLTLLQKARAYKQLNERGLSVELIAKAIGTTKRQISEHLAVFDLPSELLPYYEDGRLSLRTIPRLLVLNVEDQISIGRAAGENKWGEIRIMSVVHGLTNPPDDKDGHETESSVSGRLRPPTTKPYLERIWDRVEDGCYTPDAIRTCCECGRVIFDLTNDEIRVYLQRLVDDGRAEWRKQGGKKDMSHGMSTDICVPKGTLLVSALDLGGREIDEDDEAA